MIWQSPTSCQSTPTTYPNGSCSSAPTSGCPESGSTTCDTPSHHRPRIRCAHPRRLPTTRTHKHLSHLERLLPRHARHASPRSPIHRRLPQRQRRHQQRRPRDRRRHGKTHPQHAPQPIAPPTPTTPPTHQPATAPCAQVRRQDRLGSPSIEPTIKNPLHSKLGGSGSGSLPTGKSTLEDAPDRQCGDRSLLAGHSRSRLGILCRVAGCTSSYSS